MQNENKKIGTLSLPDLTDLFETEIDLDVNVAGKQFKLKNCKIKVANKTSGVYSAVPKGEVGMQIKIDGLLK